MGMRNFLMCKVGDHHRTLLGCMVDHGWQWLRILQVLWCPPSQCSSKCPSNISQRRFVARTNPHARDPLNLPQQTLGARPIQTGSHDALFALALVMSKSIGGEPRVTKGYPLLSNTLVFLEWNGMKFSITHLSCYATSGINSLCVLRLSCTVVECTSHYCFTSIIYCYTSKRMMSLLVVIKQLCINYWYLQATSCHQIISLASATVFKHLQLIIVAFTHINALLIWK